MPLAGRAHRAAERHDWIGGKTGSINGTAPASSGSRGAANMPGAGEAAEGTPKRLLGRATQAVAQILSKEGYLGEI